MLKDRALATSGSGTQFFIHEGRRYGHILDPRSGWPAEGVLSVSVLAPTAATADALSTAFYVMGPQQSREYCEVHPEVAGGDAMPRPWRAKHPETFFRPRRARLDRLGRGVNANTGRATGRGIDCITVEKRLVPGFDIFPAESASLKCGEVAVPIEQARRALLILDLQLDHISYLGIIVVLILTGSGLPIPEEVPIIAAGIASAVGTLNPWGAFISCLVGALFGDSVIYAIGYHFGAYPGHPAPSLCAPAARRARSQDRGDDPPARPEGVFLVAFHGGHSGPGLSDGRHSADVVSPVYFDRFLLRHRGRGALLWSELCLWRALAGLGPPL